MADISKNNYKSKYLEDEQPILIKPVIAAALNNDRHAYFLQQVKYWMNKNASKGRGFHDGRQWMYITLDGWVAEFPWLSKRTIQRIIDDLKSKGILITGNYNIKKYDKTVWYSIDEAVLDSIIDEYKSLWPKWPHGYGQNGHMHDDIMATPIPETLTETKAEADPAASTNKNNVVIEEYICQLQALGLKPTYNKKRLIKQLNDSPIGNLEHKELIKKLIRWFKSADTKTLNEGCPLGYFIKDFNSIPQPDRIYIGNCNDCGQQLYEGEEHTCINIAFCEKCNSGISYFGKKNDKTVLNDHVCDPETLKYLGLQHVL